MRVFLLLALAVHCSPWSALAEERSSFEPFTVAWKGDNKWLTTKRTHNWCSNATDLARVKRFGYILKGADVSVVFLACRNPSCANESTLPTVLWNEESGQLSGGFVVDIWNEVARRASFDWKSTVAISDIPDGEQGETFDKVYQWAADNYDVIADWVTITPSRARAQLRFAYPFVDNSLVLVGVVKVATPPWHEVAFSFLRPFSPGVWAVILASFVLAAFVYRLLEEGQDDIPQESLEDGTSYCMSLYVTTTNFTGGSGYSPKTMLGRLFTVGFNFTLLLVVAAYTANLASLLVVKSQTTAAITSIEDAVVKGAPICVVKTSFGQAVAKESYPTLPVREVRGYNTALRDVVDGKCVAAILPKITWRVSQGKRLNNPDCSLGQIGEPFRELHSSFAFRADDAVQCTAVIADYVTVILQEMALDGWLDSKTDELIQSTHDQSCSATMDGGSSQSLELRDLSGIFGVQAVTIIVCLALYFIFSRSSKTAHRTLSEDVSE